MGQRHLSGKAILITGASSGIGAAIVRVLIEQRRGHRLILTARRDAPLRELAIEAERGGCECLIVPDDLADPDAPARIVHAAIARFGRLDVLINNAGHGLPYMYAHTEVAALAQQIQVNFTAPVVLTRLALDHLIATKGTVINVGSSITCVANPIFGAYGATKAAIAYWNDALRREMRLRGVNVCLVEPGPVSTEFFQAVLTRKEGAGSKDPDAAYRELTMMAPPPSWVSATSEDVAKRIVKLIDHPKRRISVLRRIVWPFRWMGVLIQAFPSLGDFAIGRMVGRLEDADARKTG